MYLSLLFFSVGLASFFITFSPFAVSCCSMKLSISPNASALGPRYPIFIRSWTGGTPPANKRMLGDSQCRIAEDTMTDLRASRPLRYLKIGPHMGSTHRITSIRLSGLSFLISSFLIFLMTPPPQVRCWKYLSNVYGRTSLLSIGRLTGSFAARPALSPINHIGNHFA
jgi:hypothetical protein